MKSIEISIKRYINLKYKKVYNCYTSLLSNFIQAVLGFILFLFVFLTIPILQSIYTMLSRSSASLRVASRARGQAAHSRAPFSYSRSAPLSSVSSTNINSNESPSFDCNRSSSPR